jgi:hypothetical protein
MFLALIGNLGPPPTSESPGAGIRKGGPVSLLQKEGEQVPNHDRHVEYTRYLERVILSKVVGYSESELADACAWSDARDAHELSEFPLLKSETAAGVA